MPGTDRVVIRAPRFLMVLPVLVMVQSVTLTGTFHSWWALVALPLGLAAFVGAVRARTALDPDGITTCDGLRTRRLSWDDVVALDTSRGVRAVTRDGSLVVLPGVQPRAWAPEGDVARNAAQRVTDYAAALGRDVALRPLPAIRT